MKTLLRNLALGSGLLAAGATMLAAQAFAASDYTLFGDSTLIHPGNASNTAVQTVSSTTGTGYGGIDFTIPAGMATLSDLTNLSTDFNATTGGCGGGSPRFQVNVTTPSGTKNLFVYLGTAPNYSCTQNSWISSGNLVTPASLVDASQLGGTFYEPYSAVVAAYGNYPVTGIQLVTDGSWLLGTQTVLFDNTMINNTLYTYEPTNKSACMHGGWKNFTYAPGPFKNQGDCVSYFATGGKNPGNG